MVPVNDRPNKQKVSAIYMMATSRASGSAAQIKQLAGMRGLMAKPSGEIIETPIISNFREGLQYLSILNSGYLTRRLVDVAQDCIITDEDCGTTKGIEVRSIMDGGEVIVSLAEQILGRTVAIKIYHPLTDQLLLSPVELIDEARLEEIESSGLDAVMVRSVLTCEINDGMCKMLRKRPSNRLFSISRGSNWSNCCSINW
ncbi:DNA-directed RNA polymerase subunit beta'' [Platanthera guangdongensis]|uniref:DNA-directed RNA polymerase n=1 Tax=Platanthera guangdongensis TaxID=2320717 RepID=A0ABR2MB84_9ASPA